MKKRVFRSRIVYWISIVYFLIVSIALVITLIDITIFFNNKLTYFLILIAAIFSIIILVQLIEKFKKSSLLISIYLSLTIVGSLLINLNNYLEKRLSINEIKFLFFHIVFLILINYYKVNQIEFENSKEIDQIGNNNLEP